MQYKVAYCQISSYDQIMSSELTPHTPNLCNLVCGAEQDYFSPKMTRKEEWFSSMTLLVTCRLSFHECSVYESIHPSIISTA